MQKEIIYIRAVHLQMALQNPTTCTQKDSKQVFELDPYVINCAYTENTEAT